MACHRVQQGRRSGRPLSALRERSDRRGRFMLSQNSSCGGGRSRMDARQHGRTQLVSNDSPLVANNNRQFLGGYLTWLEQFDGVAIWVFQLDLHTAGTLLDLVAEAKTSLL